MAHFSDFGYMEGDELGRAYDLRLIARLAAYAGPMLRLFILAVLFILFSTGLELLLPYLTRQAIDEYIVRQALELNLERAPAELAQRLRAEAGPGFIPGQEGALFLPEPLWRKLDPRLTARLRASGAVAEQTWYLARPTPPAQEVAAAHPQLFLRLPGHLLIPSDQLSKLPADQLSSLRQDDIHGLLRLAGLFVGVILFIFLFGYWQHVLLERAGQTMMLNIRQDLYRHLLSRALAFHSRNPVGKLVTRLTSDVQNLNEMYRSTLVAFFQDFFLIMGIVVVMLVLDYKLALVCLSLTPLIAGLAWLFARLARDAFRQLQGQLGRIMARLSETLGGLAVVKLFRAEQTSAAEFKRLNNAYFAAGIRQIRIFAVFMPLTELIAAMATALIIYYGGGRAVSEQVSLGTLVAFLSYMGMFFRPVRDLAEKYNILQNALASGERIFHLLDDQQALSQPQSPTPLPGPRPGEVRFESVTFGYDPDKPVVRSVSFTIEPGQTWAVVGPTGAGKTTLVNLLLRLADPQKGRVLVDGVDLRQVSRQDLARRVALVDQEVFLFSGTAQQNITLERPWAGEQGLAQALQVSGAASFIDRLDQGLDTPLGEGARRLSAGQRQLLALARALAGSPAVLVLDEATSAVDPESERLIQQALPRVLAGRTCLVVAHRLSTVRRAHRILVMAGGKVVEQGSHQELMASGGLYARLVRLQEAATTRSDQGNGA